MATTIEYSVEKELTELVDEVLHKPEHSEFGPIRDVDLTILPCFVIRTDEDGQTKAGKGDPVKLKKISDLDRLFMKDKPHYIVVVDYGAWDNAPDEQRMAMLHACLMQISVEHTDGGKIKLGSRKPDVVTFRATVRRYGAWNQDLTDVWEAFKKLPGRFAPRAKSKEDAEEAPEEAPEPPDDEK